MKPATSTKFVGRQRELETLERKLDLAFAGHGSLAILVGEAGVGKTRLTQEFSIRAKQRGALVLSGSCFEGDWRPPYGPWVEALGQHFGESNPESLRDRLNGSAAALAYLVPELRAALPEVPLPDPLGADDERLRLFDAVRQFLLASTRENVLVLVLDDLHWADQDSLLLLRYLSRFVSRVRILVVVAYRDSELSLERRHPLADLLAMLCRETECEQVVLHPLCYNEVSEYLAQAAGQRLPQALTQTIYHHASGNPFYVREVFRHLVEEGKLLHRVGRWSTDTSIAELGIPEGVRQVVEQRVARLSDETSGLLHIAAGFAGGFAFPVLLALADLTEDGLLNCLDEALKAGLLRVKEAPGASPDYAFAHAIVRYALYDSLNPDRRARLHRRIAQAMERVYAGREREHAAELAWQYWSSASLPDAGKGLQHALAAAEQARRASALERAVSFLRMALDLAGKDDVQAKADILTRLAVAEAEALMFEEAQDTVEAALRVLSANGAEPSTGAQLLTLVARALKDGGASHTVWEPLVKRGLALVGEQRDLVWARLMLLLDRYEQVSIGTLGAGRWLGRDPDAVAIARASGEEDDYAQTLDPSEWRTRAETGAVLALARTWRRPTAILSALSLAGRDFLYRYGAFHEAIECYEELLATARRYGSVPCQGQALCQLVLAQASLGDLPLARRTLQQIEEMVARLGSVHRMRYAELACSLAYYFEGDWSALATANVQFATSSDAAQGGPLGPLAVVLAALSYTRLGNSEEARRLLECLTPVVERAEPRTLLHNAVIAHSCAVVWELGATDLASNYRRMTMDLIASGVGDLLLPHELGVARMAALLGKADEAAEYFGRARKKLSADTYRPIRAIAAYDEALFLIQARTPDGERVANLLKGATAVFAEMGLDGWAGRARELLEKLAGDLAERRPSRQSLDGVLTARETEVLRLVARGRTNKEIAADLVVSLTTVERHIANIYIKIGARGRADATAYAFTTGLVGTPS